MHKKKWRLSIDQWPVQVTQITYLTFLFATCSQLQCYLESCQSVLLCIHGSFSLPFSKFRISLLGFTTMAYKYFFLFAVLLNGEPLIFQVGKSFVVRECLLYYQTFCLLDPKVIHGFLTAPTPTHAFFYLCTHYENQKYSYISKRYLHTHGHRSIIHNSQKVKATQVPSTDEWINSVVYTYNEI